MDDVELSRSLFGFIRLQVSDQMPDDGQVARRGALELGFLDFVFSEVDLPLSRGCAHGVGVEGLGNGEKPDEGRVASGPGGGARDAIANVRQPGAEHGGVGHYFGSCATRAFAVAAFGPSGESFRYVLNSTPASASLPSFTSAIAS